MLRNMRSRVDFIPVLGIVLVCLFCVAYKAGSSGGLADHERQFAARKVSAESIEKRLDACRERNMIGEGTLHGGVDEETKDLYAKNKALSSEMTHYRSLLNDAQEELETCNADLYHDRLERKQQEQQDFQTIARLEVDNGALRARAERMEAGGSETTILTKAIGKLAVEHLRLRRALGMKTETVTPEYLEQLMVEWSGAEHNEFRDQLGKVLEPEKNEFKDVRHAEKFSSVKVDQLSLFRVEEQEGGGYTHPTWGGVTGNRPSTKGVFKDAVVPRTTVAKQLRTLKEYALCAVGQNITDLMFPALFHPDETPSATVDLRDLFITPHVSFCEECSFHEKSSAFHLLCQGYAGRDQYGGNMFWEMRSRIAPSDAVRAAADGFIAEHGLDSKTIAVRLPRGQSFEDGSVCRPGLLYFYTFVLKEAGVRELAKATDPQRWCMPDAAYVVQQLQQLMEEFEADKIFLISEWGAAELAAAGFQKPVKQIPPELHTNRKSFATLVELHIAAQLERVVVNRFDAQSALLTEEFLLNKGLKADGVIVW